MWGSALFGSERSRYRRLEIGTDERNDRSASAQFQGGRERRRARPGRKRGIRSGATAPAHVAALARECHRHSGGSRRLLDQPARPERLLQGLAAVFPTSSPAFLRSSRSRCVRKVVSFAEREHVAGSTKDKPRCMAQYRIHLLSLHRRTTCDLYLFKKKSCRQESRKSRGDSLHRQRLRIFSKDVTRCAQNTGLEAYITFQQRGAAESCQKRSSGSYSLSLATRSRY